MYFLEHVVDEYMHLQQWSWTHKWVTKVNLVWAFSLSSIAQQFLGSTLQLLLSVSDCLSQLNSDNTVVTEYGCLSNHATEKHLFQVHRQQDWLTTMCVFVCAQMGSVQELCSWSIHVVFKCNFQWNSMVISYYGITALWQPSVHSDIPFWSFDVRSSYYCDTLMLHFSRIYIRPCFPLHLGTCCGWVHVPATVILIFMIQTAASTIYHVYSYLL